MAVSPEILELQQRRAELKALLDEELKGKTESQRLTAKEGTEYKKNLKLLREINEQIRGVQDETKNTIDNYISIESKLKGLKGLQSSLVDKERDRIKIMANARNLDSEKRKTFDSIASLQNDLLDTSSEDIVQQAEINRQLDSLYSSLGSVNGIHRHIVKNLKEQRGIAEGVSSLTEGQQEQLNSQIEAYNTIKDSVGKVFDTLDLMTKGPAAGFGFLLIGAGLAAEELFKSVQKTGGFLGEFSLSVAGLGFLFEDAQGVAEGLATQLGSTEEASFGTQLNANLMAKNLGLSGEEASSLIGSFSRLNGNSTDIALDMMASAKETAKLGGVIPSKVMGDLAASADAFATYSKDGGQNIVEAAVYARQLGVSFDKLSSVADGLLDFETSITKELELGAMLGRNINLSEARRLAYAGDLEGMGREILNQMGGIAAFNDMDVFQKKAAADALGVSVGELQTMLANAEKATGEVSLMEKGFSFLSESVTAISTSIGGKLVKGLGTGLIAMGQMNPVLKDMGINFGGIVKNTAQILKNLLGMVAGPIIKGIKMVGGALTGGLGDTAIGKGIGGIKDKLMEGAGSIKDKLLEGVGDKAKDKLVEGVGDKAKDKLVEGVGDKAKDALIPQTSVSDKITETTSGEGMNMGNILKGAAAILILSAALFVAAKAFQEFGSVEWPAVALGIAGLAAMAGIAFLLGKAQGEMIKGAAAVLILGVALIPFAFAMSLIAGLDIGSVIAAAAGLLIFSAAIFALGALMGTGVGTGLFVAGVIALAALGVAMKTLGEGLLLASAGFQAFTGSNILDDISEKLSTLTQIEFLPILGLAASLMVLAVALTAVSFAGLLALPILAGLGLIAGGLGLFGGGGDEAGGGAGDTKMDELITEIRGLRSDLSSGKIGVNMDGKKVTAAVGRVVGKDGTNSYGL